MHAPGRSWLDSTCPRVGPVTQSWARLKRLSSSSSQCLLDFSQFQSHFSQGVISDPHKTKPGAPPPTEAVILIISTVGPNGC